MVTPTVARSETNPRQAVAAPVVPERRVLRALLSDEVFALTPSALAGGDPTESERLIYLGRMVSAVSHELANRLTGVLGFAELAAGRKDPAAALHLAAKMLAQAGHLRLLVAAISGFSGRQARSRESSEPAVVAQQVMELALCQAKTLGVTVALIAAPELPRLCIPPCELRLALFMCVDHFVRALAPVAASRPAELVLDVASFPQRPLEARFTLSARCGDQAVQLGDGPDWPSSLARAAVILSGYGARLEWEQHSGHTPHLVVEFGPPPTPTVS